jgi:4-aminobutyrate aminotransferase-like enzyme
MRAYFLTYFIVFLLVGSLANSQNQQESMHCQYQTTSVSDQALSVLYDKLGKKYLDPISIQNFKSGIANESLCQCLTSFEVANVIDKNVRVQVEYEVKLILDDNKNSSIFERKKIHNLRPGHSRINYDGGSCV